MRGLLVIESLYHQIVAGRKTQTRRSGGLKEVNYKPGLWSITGAQDECLVFTFNIEKQRNPNHIMEVFCKPRYRVGEVLYLKEPYKLVDPPVYIEYAFDNPNRTGNGYQNKLFMPADFARAYIRITGIKCERLGDISVNDCIAEGIEVFNGLEGYYQVYDRKTDTQFTADPKCSFISLYRFANKIYGGTISNIWVWAYTFEYLKDYKHEN